MFGSDQNPGFGPHPNPGPPVNGVSSVQTLTGTATGGTITLTLGSYTTAAISATATAAVILAAILALPNVGPGNAATSGGVLGTAAVPVSFQGALAGKPLPALVVNNTLATGGTVTVAQTTAGVKASYRGCPTGGLLTDTVNGQLYINTGPPTSPTYVKVGTQA